MRKLIAPVAVALGLVVGNSANAMTEEEMNIRLAEMKVESKAEMCFNLTMMIETGRYMKENGGVTEEKLDSAGIKKGAKDYELFQIGYQSSGPITKPMRNAFMKCLQSGTS